jgi:hypothetical protein
LQSNAPRGSADVQKQSSSRQDKWDAVAIDPSDAPRAVREYLDTLYEEAFGAATPVKPKFTAHADPTSQWSDEGQQMIRGSFARRTVRKGPAFFAYSDNYLIDTDHAIIMDVDATRSVRQAEVGSTLTMLDRTAERFGLRPDWLVADTAYGSEESLVELALKRQILPFIPVIHCPEGHCAAMSREGIKANAPTGPCRVPTLPGMTRMTDLFVRRGRICGTPGGIIPISTASRPR